MMHGTINIKLLQYVLERYIKFGKHHNISHCSVVTVQLVPVSVHYETHSVSDVPQYVTFMLTEFCVGRTQLLYV